MISIDAIIRWFEKRQAAGDVFKGMDCKQSGVIPVQKYEDDTRTMT